MDAGSQVVATDPISIVEDVTVPRRDSAITAWVNVIYGCNERCTYCVVPNTRGEEQSREPDAIMVCASAKHNLLDQSCWTSHMTLRSDICSSLLVVRHETFDAAQR